MEVYFLHISRDIVVKECGEKKRDRAKERNSKYLKTCVIILAIQRGGRERGGKKKFKDSLTIAVKVL
jgi:hypothetical protein